MTKLLVIINNDEHRAELESLIKNTDYSIINYFNNHVDASNFLKKEIPDIIIIDNSIIIDDNLSDELENKFNVPIIQIIDANNEEQKKNIHFQRYNKHLERPFIKKELILLIEFLLYQVEIETRFNESEERFRLLFETIKEGIIVQNNEGQVIASNPLAETILGITYTQIIGKEKINPQWKIIDINRKEVNEVNYPATKVLKSGIPIKDEILGISNPQWQAPKWIKINLMPQFNAGEKKPYQVYSTFLDITEEFEQKNFKEKNTILLSYFENSPIGMILCSPNGKVNYVNPALIDLLNLSKENTSFVMNKYNILMDNYLTELGIMDYFISGFQGELVQIPAVQYAHQRSKIDKESIWLKSYIYPVKDREGNIFEIVITFENVTETKRIQEKNKNNLKEKETLLKEIHHRVKNNMQIISSLLDLQQASIDDENTHSIFNDMQTRIKSMSLIHEILYKSDNFAQVDFNDYVNQLVSGVSNSYFNPEKTIHITIDVKDINLDIDYAIPCALVINELLSNSYKFAFINKKEGKITIDFHKDENENYKLVVKDNGQGINTEVIESSKTLGIRLIKALTRQINGTIDFKNQNGTTALVQFTHEDLSI